MCAIHAKRVTIMPKDIHLARRLLEEVTEDVGGVRDEDATLTFIKSRETVVMQPVCGGTTGRGGCSKRGDRGCWVCS